MSQKRVRRSYSSEEKAAILRRHLVDKKAVSDICDEYNLQPSVFYAWQRQVLENMAAALETGNGLSRRRQDSREAKLAKKVVSLEAKLAKKDHVIAEISEEYVQLKKELGEP